MSESTSSLYHKLRAFVLRDIRSALAGTSAVGGLTATVVDGHTHDDRYYSEADADSRFLNATGDTLTGNLAANTGVTVDGVDVSAHAVDANAHHNQAHVLATTSGLGPDHTVSGLTSGQVLRASNATTALFGNLAHAETLGQGPNDHHNQAHVLATNAALGADHTISGATAGHVLRASSATAAAFSQLAHTELSSIGTNTHAQIDTHLAATEAHGATGAVVGTTNTQTLTNKTLTTPTIASFANATHTHANAAGGGVLDHANLTSIGSNSHAAIDSHISATAAHGATGAVVGTTNTQTLTNKTLTLPQINDVSADHQYVFAVSELIADRTVTLPLLTGNDTFVFADFTQTLTNKTLTTPTIASFVNATHTHQNAAGGGTLDHGLALTGLGDDDHTQYLLATGARTGASSSSQTFTTGVIDSSLTATRLMASDASKKLSSVADLTSWIAGTANRVTVTSDGDGTVTLSGPQDIHSGASPTFVRATLSQATGTAPLTVSSTTVVSNLNADKADGYDFDQDVRTTGVPQFARIGAGVAAHATYKLYVLGDSLMDGHVEADSLDVNGAATVYGGDLKVFPVGDFTTPLLYVDESTRSIGVNRDPDPQFDVDVAGALRAGYLIGPHAIQLSDAMAIVHFDGPGPYATNYVGTSQTHKGDVATITGGVIYRPGKFGKAAQTGEAATNLVTNPSFETNLTGWGNQNVTTARVATYSLYGSYSMSIIGTSASNPRTLGTFAVTGGVAYTVSAWCYAPVGASLRVGMISNTATVTTTISAAAATGDWVRISATATPSTSGNLYLVLYNDSQVVTGYIDAVQAEAKAYATPFCDGSLGAGHSWSGTAHASTSSRTGTKIEYPIANVDVNAGTLAMWVYTSGYNSNGGFLWSAGYANGEWDAYLSAAGNIIYRLNGSNIYNEASKFPLETWVHVSFTWDAAANETMVYINGVLESAVYAYSTLPTLHATLFGIGSSPSLAVTYSHNGLLDDVFVLSRALDADEVRAIYESNAPVFAESSVAFFKNYGPTPVEINDEGFWVEGPTVGAIFGIYGAASTKSWGGVTLAEGDVLIGRSPAYALWDDSEVKLKIGNVSDEHIAFDGTKIEFLNGASSMGSLTNTTWVIGPAAGDRLELSATDLRFKTGASQVDAIFDANSITLGSATTMQTVITNSSFLSGDAAGENVYITSAGLYLRNASTNYLTLAGSTATIGQIANSKSRVEIDDTNGIRLISRSAGGVDTTAVSLTHAGAASFAGNVTLGSKFQLTVNAMLIGSNLATENVSFATIFENATQIGTTPGDEAFDAGDVLIGDWENANVLWDASAGQLKFRDATTVQAYVDTDGSIKAGAGAVTLDAGGITIASEYAAVSAPSVGGDPTAIVWKDGATEVAWLTVYTDPVLTLQSAGDLYISTQYDMYLSAFDGTVIVDSYMRANGPITFLEQTGAPTNPVDGTQTQTYMKGDKFVIQYNHGGTLKYRYLTLTSTDATWTYTTTAP